MHTDHRVLFQTPEHAIMCVLTSMRAQSDRGVVGASSLAQLPSRASSCLAADPSCNGPCLASSKYSMSFSSFSSLKFEYKGQHHQSPFRAESALRWSPNVNTQINKQPSGGESIRVTKGVVTSHLCKVECLFPVH